MNQFTNISKNPTSKSKNFFGFLECMMLCKNCWHKATTCCTNSTSMYGASMDYWCMNIS
ncbi:hypothetical protein [uncultured Flavobacterium sp.]|uniref:hypothetical protein n=1 Tax=uncultured Flavobacterium sp. TaxID=165435 RepID=UPI000AD39D2A|nr:hypothetical protein [uncultured Flavobacterium sp.]